MINPNDKYIFLDIDGTINSDRDFFEAKYYDDTDSQKNAGEIINRGCLAYLEHIIDDTDAKIIMSTNWRRYFSLDEIYEVMVRNGFSKSRDIIMDEYPSYQYESRRGAEIHEFVEEHKLTNFVILDDIDEGLSSFFIQYEDENDWEDQPDANWIRTDFRVGLDGLDAGRAIKILGKTEAAKARAEQYQKDLELLASCAI